MILRSLLLVIVIASFNCSAFADLRLPSKMSQSDRLETLRILGLGGSGKLLTDPYPLGGYSGFEVGISYEEIPTTDISQFGDKQSNEPEQFSYETLSIGKGLYNNLDIFFDFTPWGREAGFSEYGGMLRWGFYEAKFFPISYCALLHGNIVNIHNDLISQSFGLDLLAAINVSSFAIYFGAGRVRADGRFDARVTDSGNPVTERAIELHTFVGTSIKVDQLFVAAEIDRYTMPVYSAKLGFRY